jgi:hypothetical protein
MAPHDVQYAAIPRSPSVADRPTGRPYVTASVRCKMRGVRSPDDAQFESRGDRRRHAGAESPPPRRRRTARVEDHPGATDGRREAHRSEERPPADFSRERHPRHVVEQRRGEEHHKVPPRSPAVADSGAPSTIRQLRSRSAQWLPVASLATDRQRVRAQVVTAPTGVNVSRLEQIGEQIIEAVGRGGAAELLDAITRPEPDRAALIGRLTPRDGWRPAEVLIDLETDEPARLRMAEALRFALAAD